MSLFKLTRLGLVEELTLLINWGDIDINIRERGSGDSALMVAVAENDLSIGRILVDVGHIDLNIVNVMGNTALHIAADSGYVEFAKFLLSYDSIDANKQNTSGFTALHLAACFQHESIVEELLKLPDDALDMELKTSDGETAVDLATSKRDYYISNLINLRCDRKLVSQRAAEQHAEFEKKKKKWNLDLNLSNVSVHAKGQNMKSTPPKMTRPTPPTPLEVFEVSLPKKNVTSVASQKNSINQWSKKKEMQPSTRSLNGGHHSKGAQNSTGRHHQNDAHHYSSYEHSNGLPLPDTSRLIAPFPVQPGMFNNYPHSRLPLHPNGPGSLNHPRFIPPPPPGPPPGPPQGGSGMPMRLMDMIPLGPQYLVAHPHPQWHTNGAHVGVRVLLGQIHSSNTHMHDMSMQIGLEEKGGDHADDGFFTHLPPLSLQLPESIPSIGSAEEFKHSESDQPPDYQSDSSGDPMVLACHSCGNIGSNDGSGKVILFKMQCCQSLLQQNVYLCCTQCAHDWHKESRHECS